MHSQLPPTLQLLLAHLLSELLFFISSRLCPSLCLSLWSWRPGHTLPAGLSQTAAASQKQARVLHWTPYLLQVLSGSAHSGSRTERAAAPPARRWSLCRGGGEPWMSSWQLWSDTRHFCLCISLARTGVMAPLTSRGQKASGVGEQEMFDDGH